MQSGFCENTADQRQRGSLRGHTRRNELERVTTHGACVRLTHGRIRGCMCVLRDVQLMHFIRLPKGS